MPESEGLSPTFARAVERVMRDVDIDNAGCSDLIAVGVTRHDCLTFLMDMLEDSEPITPEWLAILTQWCVAIGVWIERERWQPADAG